MKRTIRLTESELTKMITECVKSSIRSNKKKALKDQQETVRKKKFTRNLKKTLNMMTMPQSQKHLYNAVGHIQIHSRLSTERPGSMA